MLFLCPLKYSRTVQYGTRASCNTPTDCCDLTNSPPTSPTTRRVLTRDCPHCPGLEVTVVRPIPGLFLSLLLLLLK